MVFEALKFMALGMGIVFVFLIVMIILLNTQAYIIGRFFKEEKQENTKTRQSQFSNTINQEQKVAIISTVINQHIQNKRMKNG